MVEPETTCSAASSRNFREREKIEFSSSTFCYTEVWYEIILAAYPALREFFFALPNEKIIIRKFFLVRVELNDCVSPSLIALKTSLIHF